MYPNPSSGIFSVRLDSDKEGTVEYTVMEMNGKILRTISAQPYEELQVQLNVASGVYMVKVQQGEYVEMKRVIIHGNR